MKGQEDLLGGNEPRNYRSLFVEASLLCGVASAVLAFGGTAPVSFAPVQLLFLGVAALLVARRVGSSGSSSLKGLVVPAFLVEAIFLQLCPLPASWLERFATRQSSAHLACWSIEPHRTWTCFLVFLSCLIAFCLTQIVSCDRNRKRRLVVSLVWLGTFEAFYGLVQYLTGWQRIFAYAKKYDLEEATGTYINRNHYAGFLEMILPFSLALVFYEYGKMRGPGPPVAVNRRNLLTQPGVEKLVLWLTIAVVLFVALIFSRSRAGIVAACASLLVMFGLAGISRYHGKMVLLLCAAFMVLGVGLAIWIGPGSIVNRFQSVGQEYTMNDQSRLSIWRDALGLIRRHPWLGTGLGTFPIAFTSVQTTFLGQFVNHAHNDYLELSSDLGLPAALGLFVSIFFLLVRAVRTFLFAERNLDRVLALGCVGSIVAMLLHSLTDFNLYIPANALLFSMVLGLAISSAPRSSTIRSEA
jgi:O-antigen ligase